jgi:hypothetical protein
VIHLRALIDKFTHNTLYNFLQEHKTVRFDDESYKYYIVRVITRNTDLEQHHFDLDLEGLPFLNHVEKLLAKNEDALSPPSVDGSDSNVLSRSRDIPSTFDAGVPHPKEISSVLTEDLISMPRLSSGPSLSEPNQPIHPAIPSVIYLMVFLLFMGVFVEGAVPLWLALPLGLGLACFVPAGLPQSQADMILGGISVIGWVITLLAQFIIPDVPKDSEYARFVIEAPPLLLLNFIILSGGVSIFAQTPEAMKWTRRMGNNLALIGFVLFFLALNLASVDSTTLTILVGALVGLWGVVVLGHYHDLDFSEFPAIMAGLALLFCLPSLYFGWPHNIALFAVLGVGIVGTTIIANTMTRELVSNLMLVYSGLTILLMSYYASFQSGPQPLAYGLLHGVVLLLILGQMEMRYRQVARKQVLVDRVLATSEAGPETHDVSTTVAVLGFTGAGKTSFFASLWALLDRPVTTNLWYGSAKFLHDDRALPFNTRDLRDILTEAADGSELAVISALTDREVLERYLNHRSAQVSMKHEFESGRLPDPKVGFPFVAEPNKQTSDFLNSYTAPLFLQDRTARKIPEATARVSDEMSISLLFNAELEERTKVWFGLGETTKNFESLVRNRIITRDVPGEEVRLAVNYMSGIDLKIKDLDSLLYQIMHFPEFERHRYAIRYVVEMTARFEHVIFIVDAEEFTSPEDSGQNPVRSYLLLANRLARLRGAALKRITILLNKSDELLLRGEAASRNMPNGGLRSWDDLQDDNLAMETLVEVVGIPALKMITIPITAHFACTFGGLIPQDPDDPNSDFIPSYPMVPVNVIEPVIRALMKPRDDSVDELV